MTISDRPGDVAAALTRIAAGERQSERGPDGAAAPGSRPPVAVDESPTVVRRRRPTGAPRVAKLGFQPALDGLRGFALFIILLYHAQFEWAAGGFLSLTTFFTLSGFLIVSLMLREWSRSGSLDKRRFWSRRFRRLLPASWLTLLLVVGAGALGVWDASQLRDLRTDVPAALFEVFNWHLIVAGRTYGDQFTAPSPLEHFWSLAVEQQFYIVLPVLVTAVLAIGDRRRGTLRLRPLVLTFGSLALASAALCWWFARDDLNRAYVGTDTRMAELLVGALLACVMMRVIRLKRRWARIAFDLIGLIAMVGTLWVFHAATLSTRWVYPWGMLLVAAATAVMIVGALQGGLLGRMLTLKPLVWFGGISYGCYLLHWPIFLILSPQRIGWGPYPLFALRFAATVVAAWAMFKLVEHPVRIGRLLSTRMVTVVMPLAAVAVIASILVVTSDLPAPTSLERAAASNGGVAPVRPLDVMVLGDELAASATSMRVGGETPMDVTVLATPNCGLAQGGWIRRPDGTAENDVDRCASVKPAWVTRVTAERPDVVVLWAGLRDVADRRLTMEDPWQDSSAPRNDDFLRADVGDLVDQLKATGTSVVLLSVPHVRNAAPAPPTPTTTLPSDLTSQYLVLNAIKRFNEGVPGTGYAENDDARIDRWNQVLAEVAASRGATFLDAAAAMRGWEGGEFDAERRSGGVGLTSVGAEALGAWLAPRLRNLDPAPPPAVTASTALSADAVLPVAPPAGARRVAPGDREVRAAVVGDSVAYGFGFGISLWAGTANVPLVNINTGRFGCPVARGGMIRHLREIIELDADCEWADRYPQLIADQNPDVVVLSSGVWEVVDRRFEGDDSWRHIGQPEVDNFILREWLTAIDTLGANGATVVVLTAPHIEAGVARGFSDLPESDPARIDRLNQLLGEAVALRPGVARLVDLQGWLAQQPGGELDEAKRTDGVHFRDEYVPTIGAWLGPQLMQIARGS